MWNAVTDLSLRWIRAFQVSDLERKYTHTRSHKCMYAYMHTRTVACVHVCVHACVCVHDPVCPRARQRPFHVYVLGGKGSYSACSLASSASPIQPCFSRVGQSVGMYAATFVT